MFACQYGPMSIIYSFISVKNIYKFDLNIINKPIKKMIREMIYSQVDLGQHYSVCCKSFLFDIVQHINILKLYNDFGKHLEKRYDSELLGLIFKKLSEVEWNNISYNLMDTLGYLTIKNNDIKNMCIILDHIDVDNDTDGVFVNMLGYSILEHCYDCFNIIRIKMDNNESLEYWYDDFYCEFCTYYIECGHFNKDVGDYILEYGYENIFDAIRCSIKFGNMLMAKHLIKCKTFNVSNNSNELILKIFKHKKIEIVNDILNHPMFDMRINHDKILRLYTKYFKF